MTPEQLRSLSIECEKYPRNDSMRGRYEASYCEDAIAAWGDSPLQIVNMEKGVPPAAAPVTPAAPATRHEAHEAERPPGAVSTTP